jgi:hypothetical protein
VPAFIEGGGWTVLQRRGDYGSPDDFFFRNWTDYKLGFGDPNKVIIYIYSKCGII